MATTYCSAEDVADYLRIPITATTVPNITQVEKIINRKEDELDRRIGHAWRSKKVTNERHRSTTSLRIWLGYSDLFTTQKYL